MLDPKTYYHFFQVDPTGKQIFEELAAYHYDIQSYDDNPYKTAYNEGRRAVVRWLLHKLAQSQRPEEDTTINEE